jgi:hypothetical protein
MSRVEEEAHQKAAAEAERLTKKADKEAREAKGGEAAREAFGKLVKGQQQAEGQKKVHSEKDGREGKVHEEKAGKEAAKSSSEADRKAMLARGGVMHQSRAMEQARTFQGALQRQQGETRQHGEQLVKRSDTTVKHDRVEREDRGAEVVQKAETQRDREVEQLRVEAHEEKRANAAISGDKKGDSGGGDKRGDDGAAAALQKAKQPQQAGAAAGAKAAHEVKQIPPELLEKLVSTVFLAVNQKGMREFQIELKDGVLAGAFLRITADGGKISLKFSGLDAQNKNLVESSKGELMRRLSGKGLQLAKLEVG